MLETAITLGLSPSIFFLEHIYTAQIHHKVEQCHFPLFFSSLGSQYSMLHRGPNYEFWPLSCTCKRDINQTLHHSAVPKSNLQSTDPSVKINKYRFAPNCAYYRILYPRQHS